MIQETTSDRELELDYLAAILSWCAYTADAVVTPARTEDRVEPADMSHRSSAVVMRALWAICDGGNVPDVVRLGAALEGSDIGADLIQALAARSVLPRLVPAIAGRLRELAVRRRMSAALAKASAAAGRGELEDAREMAYLANDIADGVRPAATETATQTVKTACAELLGRKGPALGTGFHTLDSAIGGLRSRALTVLGGYPGTGKSSLALAIVMNLARRGVSAGIVSCEDAPEVWGPRVLSHLVDVSSEDFWKRPEDTDFLQRVREGTALTEGMGVHFSYALNAPLSAVVAGLRSLAAKGCKLAVVDYIQAVNFGAIERRNVAVGHALQTIKAAGQALGVHTIVLSQFTKPEKGKEFAEPTNADLKETSDLLDKAEVIILLWKPNDQDDAPTYGKVSKIKWSARRPRFSLARATGSEAIVDLPHRTQEQPDQRGKGRGYS